MIRYAPAGTATRRRATSRENRACGAEVAGSTGAGRQHPAAGERDAQQGQGAGGGRRGSAGTAETEGHGRARRSAERRGRRRARRLAEGATLNRTAGPAGAGAKGGSTRRRAEVTLGGTAGPAAGATLGGGRRDSTWQRAEAGPTGRRGPRRSTGTTLDGRDVRREKLHNFDDFATTGPGDRSTHRAFSQVSDDRVVVIPPSRGRSSSPSPDFCHKVVEIARKTTAGPDAP